jgi:phosphoribosylformylglycinamidine synthase
MDFKSADETIILIGETRGHLGQSLYLREIENREDGAPPTVDLEAEKVNGDFVRSQIHSTVISACHDVSDGGLLVCIAEMAMRGSIGATIQVPEDVVGEHAWLFGEDQARYVVTTNDANELLKAAAKVSVLAMPIGITGGQGLSLLSGTKETSLQTLRDLNEDWLPNYMGGD